MSGTIATVSSMVSNSRSRSRSRRAAKIAAKDNRKTELDLELAQVLGFHCKLELLEMLSNRPDIILSANGAIRDGTQRDWQCPFRPSHLHLWTLVFSFEDKSQTWHLTTRSPSSSASTSSLT